MLSGHPLGRLTGVGRPDRLGRAGERRVGGIDKGAGEKGSDLEVGELVGQLLLEQVADGALRLGVEQVEPGRVVRLVGVGLEGEQPDLGAVAVGDDEPVVLGQLGNRLGGRLDVGALSGVVVGLSAAQQSVAAEGDDEQGLGGHRVLPSSRRSTSA